LLQRISGVRERLRIRHGALQDRADGMRRSAAQSRVRAEHGEREATRCERELTAVTTRLVEVTERIGVLSAQQAETLQKIAGIEELFAKEREGGKRLVELDGAAAVLRERRENLDSRS